MAESPVDLTLAEAERERDRLLASERRARESTEDANRMKDELLAVVSHDHLLELLAVRDDLAPAGSVSVLGRRARTAAWAWGWPS